MIRFKFSPACRRQKILRFCLLNMPEKQSDNRVQFWTHFYAASILIVDQKRSLIRFKFSSARRRQKFLRFCLLNMPEKQSYNRVKLWRLFDVASILIEH